MKADIDSLGSWYYIWGKGPSTKSWQRSSPYQYFSWEEQRRAAHELYGLQVKYKPQRKSSDEKWKYSLTTHGVRGFLEEWRDKSIAPGTGGTSPASQVEGTISGRMTPSQMRCGEGLALISELGAERGYDCFLSKYQWSKRRQGHSSCYGILLAERWVDQNQPQVHLCWK